MVTLLTYSKNHTPRFYRSFGSYVVGETGAQKSAVVRLFGYQWTFAYGKELKW
jgi:hypothetical protein